LGTVFRSAGHRRSSVARNVFETDQKVLKIAQYLALWGKFFIYYNSLFKGIEVLTKELVRILSKIYFPNGEISRNLVTLVVDENITIRSEAVTREQSDCWIILIFYFFS
jgi:hypothetical protein